MRSSLSVNAENLNARNLEAIALKKLGRGDEASKLLRETLALDPLDQWATYLNGRRLACDNQTRLDLTFDFARAGLYREAVELLRTADLQARDGSLPMVFYALGFFESQDGREAESRGWYQKASAAAPEYCFPSRLEEMTILQTAIRSNPTDARAPFYLGNLLYDKRRHPEAISHWGIRAAELDPQFATAWRNLGIGYFNIHGDASRAKSAFDKALMADSGDGRVLYERDQLWKRIGVPPEERAYELETFKDLIASRDDLSVELATLYNQIGDHEQALALLTSRRYQPWEGGEGLALGQYARAQVSRGRRALEEGNAQWAKDLFEAALTVPESLGEAPHPLSNRSDIYYWLGAACQVMGDALAARSWWTRAAEAAGDFQEMSVRPFSEMTCYQAMSLRRLGDNKQADQLLDQLQEYARRLHRAKPKIDYFATSLPAMLLFNDDLQKRNAIAAKFLKAQVNLGRGRSKRAIRLLKEVLVDDPSHPLATDLLRSIPVQEGLHRGAPAFA